MWHDSARQGTRPTAATATPVSRPARERRAHAGLLQRGEVYPDRDRFSVLVRAAAAARQQALGAVRAALAHIHDGRGVDLPALQAAVEELAEIVGEDPSAALCLTNLKRHHEYTAVHSVNVSVLALALGMHLGLGQRTLEQVALGALLHDVGKVRIPAALLDKPGPLTPDEAAIARRHPQEGHDLVAAGGDAARAVLEIIRMHHERVAGDGYPRGLAGDRIPRHVRIVGLCDAYDAMTTTRAHAAALVPDKALQELYRDAPGAFGVDLVQEFIRCLGIFPVGSVVELDDGSVGVVVAAPAGAGLWPTALPAARRRRHAVREAPAGQSRGRADDEQRAGGRRISAPRPREAGVDAAAIAAGEFGLQAA
ncbi:MAG: HD-GYP domain-containing protein [Halofilum sp. (in: g-proteobacteria)]|nr:HD-GYP domain-containing protein [Halofilum sp. (in: g-proteobacteria)]